MTLFRRLPNFPRASWLFSTGKRETKYRLAQGAYTPLIQCKQVLLQKKGQRIKATAHLTQVKHVGTQEQVASSLSRNTCTIRRYQREPDIFKHLLYKICHIFLEKSSISTTKIWKRKQAI